MSSSSFGVTVSVSKSWRSWSPGPPSRAGTCPQWCKALSIMPAKSHSARAEGFGRTARATAALRPRCILKRSSDSRVWSSVRRPHKRTVLNTLLPQFSDFVSVVREFAIECRLCSISASCRCNGGHAHVQGRTASWDSSGGEHISRPGLRSSEPLRSVVMLAADHGVNARVVPPAWLRRCCRFLRAQAVGPRTQHRHCPPPTQSLLLSLF